MAIGDIVCPFLLGASPWIIYIICDWVRIQVSNFIDKRQIKKAIRDDIKRRTKTAP